MKNMFVMAEHFLSDIVDEYGQYSVSSADGGTWYPTQAYKFLKLNYHIHSFLYNDEKSIIERTMQYIKNRTMNALTIIFLAIERNVN
jgi:YesN/AraC family two-component response regulator